MYAHMGALGEFVKQGIYVLLKKKSITEAYSCIQGKVVPHLRKRYSPLVKELTQIYSHEKLIQTKSNKVWICWLQGMENAPEIVQICYTSMKRHLTDREIIVITDENINQYVGFPEHIQRKYKEDKIPCAHFLRDMLYQYWRDYDCLVAYFIFHIFFSMIADELPEEIKKMPRRSNQYCFYLEHRLGDRYQEEWMRELTSRCCFHKLNRQLWNEAEGMGNTFLEKIREEFKR